MRFIDNSDLMGDLIRIRRIFKPVFSRKRPEGCISKATEPTRKICGGNLQDRHISTDNKVRLTENAVQNDFGIRLFRWKMRHSPHAVTYIVKESAYVFIGKCTYI